MNAYDKAISLLKIRAHHSGELQRKLLMRKFSREQVDETIKRLIEERLLDNSQFAENLLHNLIKYKNFGFYMLKAKLMQRGLEGSEAENLLKDYLSLEQEKEIALRVLERNKSLDKLKLAQKLSARGFRSEIIRAVSSVADAE